MLYREELTISLGCYDISSYFLAFTMCFGGGPLAGVGRSVVDDVN